MIAVIKYNGGNTRSVCNALARLGYEAAITDDPLIIRDAEKVIFPGVGEASAAMRYLKQRGLDQMIIRLKQPVLGICLGLQLMCRYSEEGDTECLGIFDTLVKRFPEGSRVPHTGWNNLQSVSGNLLNGVGAEEHFYFVHSYYGEISSATCASCDYILPFCSAMSRNNFFATQFHPEKSGDAGEKVLLNFLRF